MFDSFERFLISWFNFFEIFRIFWIYSRNKEWCIPRYMFFFKLLFIYIDINICIEIFFLDNFFSNTIMFWHCILLLFIWIDKFFIIDEKWYLFDLFVTILNLFLHKKGCFYFAYFYICLNKICTCKCSTFTILYEIHYHFETGWILHDSKIVW